jgi:hypothetical protein
MEILMDGTFSTPVKELLYEMNSETLKQELKFKDEALKFKDEAQKQELKFKDEAQKQELKFKDEAQKLELKLKDEAQKLELKLKDEELKSRDNIIEITKLTAELEKTQSMLASFNPRALIEFVEGHKMKPTTSTTRKDRWEIYLDSDKDGKVLYECLKSCLPGPASSVKKAASFIGDTYASASNPYHSTSHGISIGEKIVLQKLASRIQEFQLSVCIAKEFGIIFTEV